MRWGRYSDKHLYKKVHGVALHHSQKVETAQVSINWWIVKKAVYPQSRILFSSRKGVKVRDATWDESWKHAGRKKPVTKDYDLHDSICMTCSRAHGHLPLRRTDKATRDGKRSGDCRGGRDGTWRLSRHAVSLSAGKNVLGLDNGDSCTNWE